MRYKVTLRKTNEGYARWAPDIPGCWSQGLAKSEALENIKDAIEAYVAANEEFNKGWEGP